MQRCRKCKGVVAITPEQRTNIREFKSKYFYVTQSDLAKLFGVTQARISEIINQPFAESHEAKS